MTEIESLIKLFEEQDPLCPVNMYYIELPPNYLSVLLEALREKAERDKGCPCCNGRIGDKTVCDYYCAFCGKKFPRDEE